MKLYTITLKDAKGLNEAAAVHPEANPLLLGYKHYGGKSYSNFSYITEGKFANTALTDGFNIFLLDEIERMEPQ